MLNTSAFMARLFLTLLDVGIMTVVGKRHR